MKEPIIRYAEHKGDEDAINTPISLARMREIYRKDFKDNIKDLQRAKADKFCVTQAEFSFEKDLELRLFRLAKGNNGQTKIIYLGKGCDRNITIANWFAAETWGFSVIKLPNYKPVIPQMISSENKSSQLNNRLRRPLY